MEEREYTDEEVCQAIIRIEKDYHTEEYIRETMRENGWGVETLTKHF